MSLSYKIGVMAGRIPPWALASGITILMVAGYGSFVWWPEYQAEQSRKAAVAAAAASRAALAKRCANEIGPILTEAKSKAAAGDSAGALKALSQCAGQMTDPEALSLHGKLAADAESKKAAEVASAAQAKAKAEILDKQRWLVGQGAKALRQSMKNPKSFTLEEALFMDDGTGCYVYRAANSFNAIDKGAAVLVDGKMLTSDDGSRFRDLWNKRCKDRRGQSIVNYVNMYVL